MRGFKLTTFVVIVTDCIQEEEEGSYSIGIVNPTTTRCPYKKLISYM